MQKTDRVFGFSLIELMVVVSIISILTVIAVPSYQHYVERARFVEVMGAAGVYKIAVALALQQGVALRELANGVHGIPPEAKKTKNVAEVKVRNGMVVVRGTEKVKGATYILKPSADGGEWAVSGSCLEMGLCSA